MWHAYKYARMSYILCHPKNINRRKRERLCNVLSVYVYELFLINLIPIAPILGFMDSYTNNDERENNIAHQE